MKSDLSNPLTHIRIRRFPEGANVMLPEDFQSAPAIRVLFMPHERRTHASLRAIGFGTFESFAAVFGKHLLASPEALDAAAAVYEETSTFKVELLEVITALGSKRDAELDARVSEMTHHAADAARALSIALSDHTPEEYKHRRPSDNLILAGIITGHSEELETEAALENGSGIEIDWSRLDGVTKFNAGGTSI
ncbi:hypothetical protein [Paraburkholderia sp. D1E]|uniref:hypothetical protein n=1 Tax=Paraburkholderia sp. D1E TaxID=3461398 RepID=UPI0040452469